MDGCRERQTCGNDGKKEQTEREKEQSSILQQYHLIFHPRAVRPRVLICFSAEFSKDTTRVGRITTMQAYQLACMTLMMRERESLESSNVASLFYSNDRLKNKPSGWNGLGLMGLMETC